MKNDYSVFSKEELVQFLEVYEDKFKCWQNPFYILCRDKVNNIIQKLNKNIKRYGEITQEVKKDISLKDRFLEKFNENCKEYDELHEELYKFRKLLYGE